jgi:hypothetical protein
LAAAAACDGDPTQVSVPQDGPANSKAQYAASVTDFGATCWGGDDTQAFQAAVNAARNVYVPACDFHITSPVNVPTDTRIHGDGAASRLIASAPGMYAILDAVGPNDGAVYDVVVEWLGFQGSNEPWHHAFRARWGQRIRFSDNVVRNTGIMNVDNSDGVEVLRNDGSAAIVGGLHGVDLNFARNVTVRGNTVSYYEAGIQWWGGQADPAEPGFSRVKLTGGHQIENNTVTHTSAGIWGGNGEHITVSFNNVQICADVCLDAEGSDDVQFVENTAKYAGTSVLASFFYSTNILFANNTVEQDGVAHGTHSAAAHLSNPWHNMFALYSRYEDPSDISTVLRGNLFTYVPNGGGVGLVQKESSRSIVIENNTMYNTVIDMAYNNGGTAQVAGNTLYFDYGIGRPAIYVGSNHTGPYYAQQGEAIVVNNTISSTVTQSTSSTQTPAIKVWQWAWSPLIVGSEITGNVLSNSRFYFNVEYQNDHAAHHWWISNNGGRIRRTGNTTPYLLATPS